MHHHLSLRGKLIIMGSVMASLFLVALDQTIIATGLGKIVEEFNAFESLSWIVTAYLLTTTVTVPIAGKLSDLFGRKKLLLTGVAIFALGSLASGMATDITMLILARAFQGVGGGIITSNAFTIVGDLFAARERGRWQGLIGAVFGVSSVIGPLLGGWLTDGHNVLGLTTDWRWMFYINVPIAIVAFALIIVFSPALKHAAKPKVDYLGAVFLSIALATLVLAVDNTESIFGDVMETLDLSLVGLRIIMGVIVVMSAGLFVWSQTKASQPILPLKFFKNANYVKVMIIASLFGTAFMGAILYLTQFNQQTFGATPTESGMMLLPMIGGMMAASIGSGQLIARTGRYKIFMQVGMIISTVGIALLTLLTPETGYTFEGIVMAFIGFGLGLVMPVITLAMQNEFEQKDLGVATSSVQLFRGLGSTVGIAMFGALLTGGLATNLTSIEKDSYITQISQNPQVIEKMGDLSDPNTQANLNQPDVKNQIKSSVHASIEKSELPSAAKDRAIKDFDDRQSEYGDKIASAFSESITHIFRYSAVLMLLATVVVFTLKERELKMAKAEQTPGEA